MLTLGLKHKEWDCSSSSTPEGQGGKRDHAGTKKSSVSSRCSTLPIQPVASHSSGKQKPELINHPSSPVKVEVSGDDVNQSGGESDSSSDSLEIAAGSGPKSATEDFLMCSDTDEAAIKSAHKKFWKKVQASCSNTKGYLWLEAQQKQISNSCRAVWESDYGVVKTEWELVLKEDHHSFEVNKMKDRTEQLF